MRSCDGNANQELALGALPPDEAAAVERHAQACPRCAREVAQYRAMFETLADLPEPPVPAGIADAVLEKLGAGALESWRELATRPLVVALSGAIVGLALALLRQPLMLYFGRLTHGVVTGGAAGFTRVLRALMHDVLDGTVLLHTLIDGLTKVGPITQQLGEAAGSTGLQSTIVVSLALFATTAYLIGQIVGNHGREKLGHAKR